MTRRKTPYRSLSEYLKETGTTQEELATRLGLTQSYMSLLVKGRRRPSLAKAIEIEKQTGVPVESLCEAGS